jgi:hypothetical protein
MAKHHGIIFLRVIANILNKALLIVVAMVANKGNKMKKLLNYLTAKDYTFIDVLGNSIIGALVYNGSLWWLLLIIPIALINAILRKLNCKIL